MNGIHPDYSTNVLYLIKPVINKIDNYTIRSKQLFKISRVLTYSLNTRSAIICIIIQPIFPQQKPMKTPDHKRAITAWTMYDWANSSFATTIMAAVLPVYYANVAAATLPENMRSAYWAYTTTISLLLVAILGPILGAMADYSGTKKRFLTFFVLLGSVSTALLYFVGQGDYLLASFFYLFAALGFSGSSVFYESIIAHVANPDEIQHVSSRGLAIG
jgi:MFS-type transporter involved in bile tolerance (Atg22 family)